MPSNSVPFVLPNGSTIVNPVIINDETNQQNMIGYNSLNGEFSIGDNEGDPYFSAVRFYVLIDGSYRFGFGGTLNYVDWRILADGVYYGGTKRIGTDGFYDANGVKVLGAQRAAINPPSGGDPTDTDRALTEVIAAMTALGLIASP